MNNKSELFYNSGQSLFELLGAIAVIGIILIAIVGLSTKSISNSTSSRNSTQASRLSQEALEWLRIERDTDWNTFVAHGSANGATICLDALDWGNLGTCGTNEFISNTQFKRQVVLTYNPSVDPNSLEADITTTWASGANISVSKSTTLLTNWKNK